MTATGVKQGSRRIVHPFVLAAILAVFSLSAMDAAATIWRVEPLGGDWADIQSALTGAAPGDTIVVAAGTWSGVGNRDLDFGGKDLLLMSEDGLDDTVIDIQGGTGDFHRAFSFTGGETAAAEVRGFTLRNGHHVIGSAVLVNGASPTFRDCLFSDNTAEFSAAVHATNSAGRFVGCRFEDNEAEGVGGAIMTNASPLVLDDCRFTGNSANMGGALFNSGGGLITLTASNFSGNGARAGGAIYATESPLDLWDVTLAANTALQEDGGGMWSNAPVTLSEVTIRNNAANYGGGLWLTGAGSVMSDVTFEENQAYEEGGGLYCLDATFKLDRADFLDNTALAGAGLMASGGAPVLSDCRFEGNQAILMGGGLLADASGLSLSDSRFKDNETLLGGGVYCLGDPSPSLTRCAFVGNTADVGSGILLGTETLGTVVDRATFWDNQDGAAVEFEESGATVARAIIAGTVGGPAVATDGLGTPACLHCCAHGNDLGDTLFPAGDNIVADPLLCDPAAGDLRVDGSSPCLPMHNAWSALIGAFDACTPTAVPDTDPVPGLLLAGPYPNPTTSTSAFTFRRDKGPGELFIDVHDLAGRRIRTLLRDASKSTGTVVWDGRDDRGGETPAGVYLVRARLGGKTATARVLRLR